MHAWLAPHYLLALVRRKFPEGVVRTRNVPKVGLRNQSCWLCWRGETKRGSRGGRMLVDRHWSNLVHFPVCERVISLIMGIFSCCGQGWPFKSYPRRLFPRISKCEGASERRCIAKVSSNNSVLSLLLRMLQLLQLLHFSRTLPNFCLLRCMGEWDGPWTA